MKVALFGLTFVSASVIQQKLAGYPYSDEGEADDALEPEISLSMLNES